MQTGRGRKEGGQWTQGIRVTRHGDDRASILLTSPAHPLPPSAVQQVTTATPSSQRRYTP